MIARLITALMMAVGMASLALADITSASPGEDIAKLQAEGINAEAENLKPVHNSHLPGNVPPESSGGDEEEPSPLLKNRVFLAVMIALGFLCLFAGLGFARFRKERSKSYLFPVMDTPRRLGANYAAGIGAVLAFHSKVGSPSSQRNQMPDYLRRV